MDVADFRTSIEAASKEASKFRKRDLMAEATALYHADLLPESDTAWAISARMQLSQSYDQALLDLAETQKLLFDYAGAERALELLLAHDPLREEAHLALMRIYSAQGHPTRIQQQFQALERVLKQQLGLSPTFEIIRIAAELRETAGRNATRVNLDDIEDGDDIEKALDATDILPGVSDSSQLDYARDVSGTSRSGGRNVLLLLASVVLLAVMFISGGAAWNSTHGGASIRGSTRNAAVHNAEKWVYTYQPRPGEKPNSEGRAIAADGTGIYVTGLIQTEHDDADILTLKLTRQGKMLWADRYSSAEHDCDRAFSECLDTNGGLYVAGETYVPKTSREPEGWRLTLLHYDGDGHRLWVKRSPMRVQNVGECVQAASDTQGGCYLAGTAIEQGSRSIVVLHYSSHGDLLWQRNIREGLMAVFNRVAVSGTGVVYLCGTTRSTQPNGGIRDDWLIARINGDGETKWVRKEEGVAPGEDTTLKICVDLNSNVLISGVVGTWDASTGVDSGLRMALEKLNPDGARIWWRVVANSGPAVVVEGISVNTLGDVMAGGTEKRSDGTWNVVFVRYDAWGNLSYAGHYSIPAGNKSAALANAMLFSDSTCLLTGEVGSGSGYNMHNECTAFTAVCAANGSAQEQFLYHAAPVSVNVIRDAIMSPGAFLTGQTGTNSMTRSLMVLSY